MNSFYDRLNLFTKSRYYRIKFVVILTGAILFFAMPAFQYLPETLNSKSWDVVTLKSQHPFSMIKMDEVRSHASKMSFRITVPAIAKILYLPPLGIYILQFLCGLVFLGLFLSYSERLMEDKVAALLLTCSVGMTYVGESAFVDIYAWFDSFVFLFVLAGLFVRGFHWKLLFFFAALFTDERAYLTVILAMIMGIFQWQKSGKGIFPAFLSEGGKIVYSGLLAILLSLCGRLYLYIYYDLYIPVTHEPNMGPNTLIDTLGLIGFSSWTYLEGLWIVVFFSIIYLFQYKRYFMATVVLGIIVAVFFASGMVLDQTRTGSYIYVISIIAAYVLREYLKTDDLRKLLTVSAVACFLFPAIVVVSDMSDKIYWFKPVYIRILSYILQ